MSNKLLIIGRKSFIAQNVMKYTHIENNLISFEDFFKKGNTFLGKYSYILNCSSNRYLINNRYDSKFDFDLRIAHKIKNINTKLIFLSSRKIYKIKDNIKENNIKDPKCFYSKNKFTTEKKLKKILKKKLLVLRLSNLIGLDKKKRNRKLHKTFFDIYKSGVDNGILFKNPGIYKDFLPIATFVKILSKMLQTNCTGIYNVSFGNKVYLDKILNWLNYYNTKPLNKVIYKINKFSENQDCFYLNNDKLKKAINLKLTYKNLENEIKKVGKDFHGK